MKAVNRTAAPRRGFTLIEILVVIAIIAILIGLLSAAVMRTLYMAPYTQTWNDIRDLDSAVEKFKTKYGVYPPSRILLSNDPTKYAAASNGGDPSNLGPSSWAYLTKIWPKLVLANQNKNPPFYDWSNGTMKAAGLVDGQGHYSVVLEGDQCLVFFLGGLQVQFPNVGCVGFYDSPRDPTAPLAAGVAGEKKVPPYFAFVQSRLIMRNPNHTFLSYQDANGPQPYAYFVSSGGKLGTYSVNDCQSLGLAPYFQGWNLVTKTVVKYDPTNSQIVPQYYNPERFQIISAGRDQTFGPGGEYNLTLAVPPLAGKDDQSNFHNSILGTPD